MIIIFQEALTEIETFVPEINVPKSTLDLAIRAGQEIVEKPLRFLVAAVDFHSTTIRHGRTEEGEEQYDPRHVVREL